MPHSYPAPPEKKQVVINETGTGVTIEFRGLLTRPFYRDIKDGLAAVEEYLNTGYVGALPIDSRSTIKRVDRNRKENDQVPPPSDDVQVGQEEGG